MRVPRRKGLPDSRQDGPRRPTLSAEAGGWREQEKRIAAAVPGGEQTRGSGSSTRASRKSDVVGTSFRVEGKLREKPGAQSLSIKREWLAKVRKEAADSGLSPAFAFGFEGDPDDWLAFPMSDASALMRMVDAALTGQLDVIYREAQRFKP